MRQLLPIPLLLLAACGSAGAGVRPAIDLPLVRLDSVARRVTAHRSNPGGSNPVTDAAGLLPLRLDTVSPGREVRVWIGGGLGYPQRLYRFVQRDGRVEGEIILYWPLVSFPDDRPGETAHDLMVYSQAGSCDQFATNASVGICRAHFVREPDWGAVLRQAEAEGLRELPDPSSFPTEVITLDGWGMTVKIRDGDHYRKRLRASSYSRVHQVARVIEVKPWTGAECGEPLDRTPR